MVDAKANVSASLDGNHHRVIELEPQEMYRRGLLIRRARKIFVGHRKYLIVAPTFTHTRCSMLVPFLSTLHLLSVL